MSKKDITKYVDESGLLLTETAMKSGMSKPEYYSLLRESGFQYVSHGVYAAPETQVDEALVLYHRCRHAVFSHDEALYYHGLTDRKPDQLTITLYTGYNPNRLRRDGIRVYTVKRELLDIGKTFVTNSFGNEIPMYDLERTVCDLVRSRSQFDPQDYKSALKAYVRKFEIHADKLFEYARLFRVEKILRGYLEVVL